MLVITEDKVGVAIHILVESSQNVFKELYAVGEVVGSSGEILKLWNDRRR